MRLRRSQLCPIHRSLTCCGREVIKREERQRQLGVRRIDDSQHPRGYRELRSNGEMRKLLDRKIVAQNGKCSICEEKFTDYSDIVPDHISPRGMGGACGTITLTTFRRCTGGATARKDRAAAEKTTRLESRRMKWRRQSMASMAQEHSLFEIDRELDTLLDEIEEEIENRGEAPAELLERFQQFCEAHGERRTGSVASFA